MIYCKKCKIQSDNPITIGENESEAVVCKHCLTDNFDEVPDEDRFCGEAVLLKPNEYTDIIGYDPFNFSGQPKPALRIPRPLTYEQMCLHSTVKKPFHPDRGPGNYGC